MSSSPSNVQQLLEKIDPRAGPLIITIFGDTIKPRGEKIWLGDLINLLQPFNLSERLVRTGVYRLSQEQWLSSSQMGRRSYYEITPDGLTTFAHATSRIYSLAPRPWDGKWLLVQALPDTGAEQRKSIRQLLIWRGFGQLSPTLLIKPGVSPKATSDLLKAANLSKYVSLFTSDLDETSDPITIAKTSWALEDFSHSYLALLKDFSLIDDSFCKTDQDAFVVRSLLIHQYRRILLKDPQLPDQMLPKDYAGSLARQRVAELYKTLSPKADNFINQHIIDDEAEPHQVNQDYKDRFAAS